MKIMKMNTRMSRRRMMIKTSTAKRTKMKTRMRRGTGMKTRKRRFPWTKSHGFHQMRP